MNSTALEEIVAKVMPGINGNNLPEPLPPGTKISYAKNGAIIEGTILYIFLRGQNWRIIAENSLTKRSEIVPLSSIASFLKPQFQTDVDMGDVYSINVRYQDGTIKPELASVLTQSTLKTDSDTYLKIYQSNHVCHLKTAKLAGIKPLEILPA